MTLLSFLPCELKLVDNVEDFFPIMNQYPYQQCFLLPGGVDPGSVDVFDFFEDSFLSASSQPRHPATSAV